MCVVVSVAEGLDLSLSVCLCSNLVPSPSPKGLPDRS